MDDNLDIDPIQQMFAVLTATNESVRIVNDLAERKIPAPIAVASLLAATVLVAYQVYNDPAALEQIEEDNGLDALINDIRKQWMIMEQSERSDGFPTSEVGHA